MKIVILSPHFDDAVFSCGPWIAELLQNGTPVEVWTIFTGLPPDDYFSELGNEYHRNWNLTAEEVIETRMLEDKAAMNLLGVPYRYFSVPDGLYRKHVCTGEHLYPDEDSLFGGLHPGDRDTLRLLGIQLTAAFPEGEFILVSPLAVGNHVDHQLVRAVIEQMSFPVWYYPDYPYTRKFPHAASKLAPPGYLPHSFPISASKLPVWQECVAAYASQISSFWSSPAEMRQELAQQLRISNGIIIWQPESTISANKFDNN
jgi:LmbE family N-acetylglucosaminyl deacetylase